VADNSVDRQEIWYAGKEKWLSRPHPRVVGFD